MGFVLEKAYDRAYRPFLECLLRYPEIKVNMHISGWLFLWLLKNRPEYVERLRRLVSMGQVEIVSGGMYEPVLSLVPASDAIDQIRLHRRLMKKVFGVSPKALWLAERVYEPHFPSILARAGILCTLVDDNHFMALGFKEEELYGYFKTEFEGRAVFLFPGLKFLRYAIPFKTIDEIDGYFRSAETKGAELLTFGDDGEKFGLWPGTFRHCYEDGWLEGFFSYLRENSEWIRTKTFGEHMALCRPKGLVYLDCNSYSEMGEWAYPAEMARLYEKASKETDFGGKRFLRGGYFKYFLLKYPESNDMHKRMVEVSNRAKRGRAREYLFLAQCNDAYWHGIFGGLYLPHLRSEVYRNLLKAESLLPSKKGLYRLWLEDVNFDGFKEAVFSSQTLKAYFFLKEGGTLYELDHRPSCTNIMANLTRRYEGYHERLTSRFADVADGKKTIHEMTLFKEPGIESNLFYDWYRRASLIDHVMGEDVDFETFYQARYKEPGDFVKEPYAAKVRRGDPQVLVMKREGHFWKEGAMFPLSLTKEVRLTEGGEGLLVDYSLEGEVPFSFLLGVEFNFSFLSQREGRFIETEGGRFSLDFKGALGDSSYVKFHDPFQGIEVSLFFQRPFSIWTFPVEVVSLSEEGFERNYECTSLMPIWRIEDLKEKRGIHIELHVRGLSHNNNA